MDGFHSLRSPLSESIRFSYWPMAQADLIHYPVYSPLAGDMYSLRLFRQQRLIYPDPSISIITCILTDDFFHGIRQILILPGTAFVREIFIEVLSADAKHPAIKGNFSVNPAVLCFQSQKDHSLVCADSRRLAAKKALASSRNSFSSFRRWISLSCSFTLLRSMVISSYRLIALAGGWEPSPISSLPALTAFSHVWMVPSGIPNSLAALAPPISLASFTACTLYSWSYLRATLNTSLFSWFYYEILENKLSTFFISHQFDPRDPFTGSE